MANVTLHPPGETPAQASAPASNVPARQPGARPAILHTTDTRGRQIGWRKLNALEDFDLTEIAGANSGNEEWMLRASIAFGVREIDGDPVARPANKQQLRALVARLDDEGMTAVLRLVTAAAEEANADGSTEMDRAKN